MADVNLKDLAAALALSAGVVHPYGHIAEASAFGVPGRVNYSTGIEEYSRAPWERLSKEEQARVHAAGFKGQADMAKAFAGTDFESAMRIANALEKVGYAAGIKPAGTRGDPELIAESTDNKRGFIDAILVASALADVDKGMWHKDRKWSLDPEVIGRGYGLKLTMPF